MCQSASHGSRNVMRGPEKRITSFIHSGLLVGAVAMNGAPGARWLPPAVGAAVQSTVGVVEKLPAVGAEFPSASVPGHAVDCDHGTHGLPLPPNPPAFARRPRLLVFATSPGTSWRRLRSLDVRVHVPRGSLCRVAATRHPMGTCGQVAGRAGSGGRRVRTARLESATTLTSVVTSVTPSSTIRRSGTAASS